MRRKEIVEAITEISKALELSDVIKAVSLSRSAPEKPDSESLEFILQALRTYSLLAQNYSPAARAMVNILGIEEIEYPRTWAEIISPQEHLRFPEFWLNLRFTREQLPKLIPILSQDPISHTDENGKEFAKGMKKLTVVVFEPDNTISSPTRLANVLESINHFYTLCALMGQESPSTLSVISCDSGSDKSFDFLGVAKVMECVERLITNIWDRVVFYREHQFEERLDLIAKSLPILQTISKMEKHKELEPELAEILRRNLFDGTNKFVQSGATIPQINDISEYNPKRLLSPVQKLLVSATPDSLEELNQPESFIQEDVPNEVREEEINLTNLSSTDQATLRALLRKASRAATVPTGQQNHEKTQNDKTFSEDSHEQNSETP